MSNPRSILNGVVRRLRRPSPAMVVALVALFLSAGGASYAAVTYPAHSIGATQLKTFAVTNPKLASDAVGSRKIMPGAVGFYRVNRNEVQLRVNGTCTAGSQAVTSVTVSGGVTCGSTSPTESDTGAGTPKALSGTATTLASYSLPGGTPYYVQADPYVTLTSGATDNTETVTVTCTLAAGPATSDTQTRSVSITVPGSGGSAAGSVPLVVTPAENANAITSSVSCTDVLGNLSDTPTVDAQSTIYALTIAQASTTTSTTTTPTTTTAAAR
jgi:hypothetical protein